MSNINRYFSYRIRLEKLKLMTWLLIVLARLLLLLTIVTVHFVGQS